MKTLATDSMKIKKLLETLNAVLFNHILIFHQLLKVKRVSIFWFYKPECLYFDTTENLKSISQVEYSVCHNKH